MQRIGVSLLTGFLGSGKTSLLKRLLADPALARTAVLVNEIGEVGLDHLLLEQVDDEVVLLKSGCVCCSIRGDLKEAILRLLGRMTRGEIAAFERIVIETTGLADPAPIVATLSADPVLCHHVELGNIVTVVDAIDGAANLERFAEARHQAAVADRIVVSKTDLIQAPPTDLVERLRALNPTAVLQLSAEDDRPPSALLVDDLHDLAARQALVAHWLEGAEHHGHAHRHDITTCLLALDQPLDWVLLGLWLTMLLNRHGTDILRIKGLVHVAGQDTPLVIHGVQHTMHRPIHLDHWPPGVSGTRLVVIGRHLDAALLQRSFAAFMGLAHNEAIAPACAPAGPML